MADPRPLPETLCALATEIERAADLHVQDFWRRLDRPVVLAWAGELREIASTCRNQ